MNFPTSVDHVAIIGNGLMGHGLARNQTEGELWLRRAVAQGRDEAKQALKRWTSPPNAPR